MNLESAIQSEVSQKEKNKYYILMAIYGIQKYGTDETIRKAEIETQAYRTNMDTNGEMWGGMNWKIGIDIYILLCIKQIKRTYCVAQGTFLNALW